MKTKSILTIAILSVRLASSACAQDLYYLYNGQRIPLAAVPGKVAVRSNAADPAQAQRSLATAAAVPDSDAQPLGIPGWTIVRLGASGSAALRSLAAAPGSTARAAQTMSAQAGVAYAAPVFNVDGSEVIPTGELLVQVAKGADGAAVLAALRETSITGSNALGGGIFKVTTNLKDGVAVVQLANRLNGRPGIVSAEPNLIQSMRSHLVPTDPLFPQAWGLRNTGQYGGRLAGFDVGATSAWDVTQGSSTVVVVVFECGIDPAHPDINAVAGRDFTNQPVANAGPRPTRDETADNHGTWVAGCISGRANNGLGATGVAPGVRVASARIGIPISDGRFQTETSWKVSALDWAIRIGARVTNHSYGGSAPSSAMDSAFARSRRAGIIHFAATGNDNKGTALYPARGPYVVGVGAANPSGARASFSNYGTGLDFMAPGQTIVTTDRVGARGVTGDYATVDGTSFASPYAAGVAALIFSRNPTWTPTQVERRMRETCTNMGTPGKDTKTGYGLLNAARALGATVVPLDDHGNTIGTATGIGTTSATAGVLGVASDEDFFRFTLTNRMEVTVASASAIDTFGHLLNAAGSTLASNDNADGRSDFRIVAVLNPGTYYVRVRGYAVSTTGSYVLHLSVGPEPRPEIGVTGNAIEIVSGSASVTPGSGDGRAFGLVATGTYRDQVFTVRNTGTGTLRLTGSPAVAMSGATAQFRVLSQPAATVAPGASSTFTVRFQPTIPGAATATVSIANDDSDESTYRFLINGGQ